MPTPTRTELKREFIRAAAEFLGGTNQVRMAIALQMKRGELYEVAQLWVKMRQAVPFSSGYPTIDEAAETLQEFLG